jgi:hypothetical protein
VITCRSTSPDNDACTKERGHKGQWHVGVQPGKRNVTLRWCGGIKTQPFWERIDDGYMSEADLATWGRLFR